MSAAGATAAPSGSVAGSAAPATEPLETDGLHRVEPGAYAGEVGPGWLVLSEVASSRWDVRIDGEQLAPVPDVAGNVYEVPRAGELEIAGGSRTRHLAVVLAQLLVIVAIVSLAVRPPRSGAPRREIADVHVGPHPAPMPGPAARAAAAATITGDLR